MAVAEIWHEAAPNVGAIMPRENAESLLGELDDGEPSRTGPKSLLRIVLEIGLDAELENGARAPFIVLSDRELSTMAEIGGIPVNHETKAHLGQLAARYGVSPISPS